MLTHRTLLMHSSLKAFQIIEPRSFKLKLEETLLRQWTRCIEAIISIHTECRSLGVIAARLILNIWEVRCARNVSISLTPTARADFWLAILIRRKVYCYVRRNMQLRKFINQEEKVFGQPTWIKVFLFQVICNIRVFSAILFAFAVLLKRLKKKKIKTAPLSFSWFGFALRFGFSAWARIEHSTRCYN